MVDGAGALMLCIHSMLGRIHDSAGARTASALQRAAAGMRRRRRLLKAAATASGGAAPSAPAVLSERSGALAQPRSASLPARGNWLLKNVTVYTVDDRSTVIANAAVAIEDGVITAVGKASEVRTPPNAQTIDAAGHMIVPGFVNPHWHEVSVFRLKPPASAEIDDRDVTTTVFSRGGDYVGLVNMYQDFFDLNFVMTPEEAYALSFYALMNQLRTGTTFVGDFGSVNHWDGMARAMIALGMRGGPSIWSIDTMLDPATGKPASTRPADKVIAANEAMLSRWAREPEGLVRAQPSVLLPLSSSNELLTGLGELSARYDVPFVMHAAAARNERHTSERFFGRGSIQRLERAGVLSPRLTLAHAAFITDSECELLIAKGVNITHTPAKYGTAGESTISETKQLARFAQGGGSLSVSTDGARAMECGSMVQAMRFGYMMNNEANADETTFTPTAALAMASIAAARSAGRQDEIGSLEVGKRADLVMIRCDDWRYTAVRKPLTQFMSNGGHADVARVFVDGRLLVSDGEVLGVDEEQARRAFLQAARSVLERVFNVSVPSSG